MPKKTLPTKAKKTAPQSATETIEQKLREVVEYELCLPLEDLNDSYQIWEMSDSLDRVGLAVGIDDEFGVDVEKADWFLDPKLTFRGLVEHVTRTVLNKR
jgi:acyl carrier protein